MTASMFLIASTLALSVSRSLAVQSVSRHGGGRGSATTFAGNATEIKKFEVVHALAKNSSNSSDHPAAEAKLLADVAPVRKLMSDKGKIGVAFGETEAVFVNMTKKSGDVQKHTVKNVTQKVDDEAPKNGSSAASDHEPPVSLLKTNLSEHKANLSEHEAESHVEANKFDQKEDSHDEANGSDHEEDSHDEADDSHENDDDKDDAADNKDDSHDKAVLLQEPNGSQIPTPVTKGHNHEVGKAPMDKVTITKVHNHESTMDKLKWFAIYLAGGIAVLACCVIAAKSFIASLELDIFIVAGIAMVFVVVSAGAAAYNKVKAW